MTATLDAPNRAARRHRRRGPGGGIILNTETWQGMTPKEVQAALNMGFRPSIAGGAVAAQGAVPAAPFTASAHEHVEPAFTVSATPGATVTQFNPQNVPAYGYVRHLYLDIQATGGVGGTLAADAPWNIIQSITLQDVNGANIVGPMDGYALYLANLVGGYANRSNPQDAPDFVGSAPNPSCFLRVPVEISRKDGLGALANQNAAANYQVAITLNTSANIFSVAPTTAPLITIRAYLEAWTLPAPMDNRGTPQSQVPPMLGTGQYWSTRNQAVAAGANTIGLTRVGNYIRNLVFIARDGTGARADTVFPDPLILNWDGMQVHNASQRYLRQFFYEKTNGILTRPTGVFVLPFDIGGADQALGNETPDLWLPTTQSSRIEATGNSAGAGTVQVLTNEVAPVDADQTTRYQWANGSGAYAANVPPTTAQA